MNVQLIQRLCSVERFAQYQRFCGGDDVKAWLLYQYNIELSESLYTSLSILEITLRNVIHRELTNKYNSLEWYNEFAFHKNLEPLHNMILSAKENLNRDNKAITPDNIVATLNFGFWTSVFNYRYERILWNKLRFAFPHMPRKRRTRKNVSSAINRIRQRLRNRVYHYEPICWKINRTKQLHDEIYQLLGWINEESIAWLNNFDRFPNVIDQFPLSDS